MGRLFNRSFKASRQGAEADLDQGMYYFYLIVCLQIVFTFGLLAAILVIGKVISTPLWVYLVMFSILIGGSVYVYRKIKKRFRKFCEMFRNADSSGRNYEISFMGGFLTMRVEQPSPNRLLEVLPASEGVIDAEPLEASSSAGVQGVDVQGRAKVIS